MPMAPADEPGRAEFQEELEDEILRFQELEQKRIQIRAEREARIYELNALR